MPYLANVGREFEKNYCYIGNQDPRFCLIANFGIKMKILKFGTKNVLFAYFWAKI